MTIGAGCLCGAVRITLAEPPFAARTCWCRVCQHLTGGGSTYNVFVRTEGLTITGEIRWHVRTADSGNTIERGFCPECGSPLMARGTGNPGMAAIRIGALDDPELLAPQSVIWTSSAPSWACIDPALPQVERQPPPIG